MGLLLLVACTSNADAPPPPAPTVTLIPITSTVTITPTIAVASTSSAFNPDDLPTYTPVVDEFLPPSANIALDAVFAQQPIGHLVNLRRIRWRNEDTDDKMLNCDIRYHVNLPSALDGYRMVIQAGDDIIVYLADDNGNAVQCDEEPLSIEGRPLVFDPTTQDLVDLAKNDLIRRLQVNEAFVIWRDIVAVTWADSSLGCPVPNATYESIDINGYWLNFMVDNVQYTYHSDGLSVKPCPSEQVAMPLPFATTTITPTPAPVTPTTIPTIIAPEE